MSCTTAFTFCNNSSSPIELVEPIAKLLGIDNVIATKIKLDENGCCVKEFELYIYNESKPVEVRRIADELGIDLDQSFAYSDSDTDRPLLECVQYPHVVNPDKKLKAHAHANGSGILQFERPEALGDTLTARAANSPWVQASVGVAGAAVAGF